MQFTALRADGTTELRQHIAFTLHDCGGGTWEARRKDGSVLVRSYRGRDECEARARTCTEPVTK